MLVALIKNLLHLTISSTGGVGELSNFLLAASFVLPAGLIYKSKKTKLRALTGAVCGAVIMGVIDVIVIAHDEFIDDLMTVIQGLEGGIDKTGIRRSRWKFIVNYRTIVFRKHDRTSL